MSPDYSIGAKLPEHLEERSNRFKVVLQQLIKEKYFGPSEIGCMDELPLVLTLGKEILWWLWCLFLSADILNSMLEVLIRLASKAWGWNLKSGLSLKEIHSALREI